MYSKNYNECNYMMNNKLCQNNKTYIISKICDIEIKSLQVTTCEQNINTNF